MIGIKNKKRLLGLFLCSMAALVFLIVTLGSYTLVRSGELQEIVENQWTREVTVAAQRGSIVDRNGEVLAQSASTQSVLLRPKEISAPGQVADLLSNILGIDRQKIFDVASDKTKVEVWLKRHITNEQADQITSLNLDGVEFFIETKRYYPNSEMLSQVLGYTTIDGLGQEGLEKKYNKYLAGTDGVVLVQVDGKQVTIQGTEQVYVEAEDGLSLVLTIDSAIQSFAESAAADAMAAYQAEKVVALVMDPNNGDILAMVNNPGMDLNNVDRSDLAQLAKLSKNTAVVDAYEPGSTFKIITTASALDSGAIDMNTTFDCIGYEVVDGQKIKCWRSGRPHGHQSLLQGVANSCNPCFMKMALKMGTNTFYKYIKNFGFGSITGIDYSADAAGIVRDSKYVKNVDLARIGFGQSIAITPLQLISAVSATINGGKLYTPRLVSAMKNSEGETVETLEVKEPSQVISEQTSSQMREILANVVANGSGRNAQIEGYTVGGKTGTAQMYENGVIAEGKNISSFIGFTTVSNPQFVVLFVVYVPNTSVTFGSVVAAPYVKEILEKCLKYTGVAPDDTTAVVEAKVPALKGMTTEQAKAALAAVGLNIEYTAEGTISSQLPVEDSVVAAGSTVYVETTGTQTDSALTVPDLKGKTLVEAVTILEEAGYTLKLDGEAGNGIIETQTPAANSALSAGSYVTVTCEKKMNTGQDTQ